jgi:hypothetical protein
MFVWLKFGHSLLGVGVGGGKQSLKGSDDGL